LVLLLASSYSVYIRLEVVISTIGVINYREGSDGIPNGYLMFKKSSLARLSLFNLFFEGLFVSLLGEASLNREATSSGSV
jgi:hypothetical protein